MRNTISIGAKCISPYAAAVQNQPKSCFTLDAYGMKIDNDELECCNLSTSVRKGVLKSPSGVTKDRAKSTITFFGVTHGEGHFCVPPPGKNVVANASNALDLYASYWRILANCGAHALLKILKSICILSHEAFGSGYPDFQLVL